MRSLLLSLLIVLTLPSLGVAQQDFVEAQEAFLTQLQGHLDDIHDALLRFHRLQPLLEGQVILKLLWEDGRLVHGEVVEDATGDERVGQALLKLMGEWNIEGLEGPAEFTVPFATRIKGREDPAFGSCAILTGQVTDLEGRPVAGAELDVQPERGPLLSTRTNREGLYVITLVPPGTYRLRCRREGFFPLQRRLERLGEGEHRLIDVQMEPREADPGR